MATKTTGGRNSSFRKSNNRTSSSGDSSNIYSSRNRASSASENKRISFTEQRVAREQREKNDVTSSGSPRPYFRTDIERMQKVSDRQTREAAVSEVKRTEVKRTEVKMTEVKKTEEKGKKRPFLRRQKNNEVPKRVSFTERREQEEAKKPLVAHIMDYKILFLALFLFGFGLIMVYSTSSYSASISYNDAAYWMKRQLIIGCGGVLIMLLVARFDYHFFLKHYILIYALYIFNALLLIITFFSPLNHGSKRWLYIGPLSIQPSEIAKVTLILFIAMYVDMHVKEMNSWKGILKLFIMTIPILLMVGLENLSTCIILFVIVGGMLFVATSLIWPFLIVGGMGVAGAIILLIIQPYRLDRITVWLDPENSESGLQTMQGLYAIGSGGFFGKGLGHSMQKMGFVPESHNDMIFSIICEELGLFGAICVIVLFAILIYRILQVANNSSDIFGSMIAVGVILHIGFQVFVNIGVVTNTIPNTGVTLPFISYGGTSLLFLMIEIGLVLSVSRYMRYAKRKVR